MFSNKVVLITGGSAGIGASAAESFTKENATVVIVGRNEEKLKEVAQRCEKLGGNVLTIKADISKDDEASTIVKQTIDKFGKLDVLVNNAGIVRFAGVQENNALEIYDEVINTNLRSVIQISNLAFPYLKKSKGNVVNVSSVASTKISFPGMSAYAVSKAGMDHFTRACAVELAPHGVRVNSVNPGPVKTEIMKSCNISMEKLMELTASSSTLMTPLGRVSDVEEIADVILFLASDKAKGVTGSFYVVDNGSLL